MKNIGYLGLSILFLAMLLLAIAFQVGQVIECGNNGGIYMRDYHHASPFPRCIKEEK